MTDDDLAQSWRRIRAELRTAVSDATWQLYLEALDARRLDGGTLVVTAPDESRRVGHRALQPACCRPRPGACSAPRPRSGSSGPTTPSRRREAPAPATRSLWTAADVPFNPRFTFDQFVIGDSNRLAHGAALAVAEMPALAYNPLFICGPPGLGKTHLLHSIANYVAAYGDGLTVRYTTVEAFTNHFIGALHNDGIDAFKTAYRGVDVLLVDDVQFLQRKAKTEEEFFHTFNALHASGAQLVLTSDRLPRDMGALEDRLRERFEAGLVCDVKPPDFGTRLTILRKRVLQDGVRGVDPDALELIAERVDSNIRALEGALIRIVAFGSLTGRAVDHRARRGGPRRPLSRPAPARPLGRGDPAPHLPGLRHLDGRPRLHQPRPGRHLAPPGRDVPHARAHRRHAAGDRPRVRQPQPHDRPARLQADRRAHRRGPFRLRHRPAPAHGAARRCRPGGLKDLCAPPPRILRGIPGFVHTIHNPDDGDSDLIITTS